MRIKLSINCDIKDSQEILHAVTKILDKRIKTEAEAVKYKMKCHKCDGVYITACGRSCPSCGEILKASNIHRKENSDV